MYPGRLLSVPRLQLPGFCRARNETGLTLCLAWCLQSICADCASVADDWNLFHSCLQDSFQSHENTGQQSRELCRSRMARRDVPQVPGCPLLGPWPRRQAPDHGPGTSLGKRLRPSGSGRLQFRLQGPARTCQSLQGAPLESHEFALFF